MEVSNLMRRLEEDVKNVKEEVKNMREEVKMVKERQVESFDCIDELKRGAGVIEKKLSLMEDRIEAAEQYSRRENLLFYGIPEKREENVRNDILNIFKEVIPQQQWNEKDIVRAHRLGKFTNQSTRPIIVKFTHHIDKMRLLNERDNLKKKRISISNDLTGHQRRTLKNLHNEGKKGYYKGGRLHWEELPTTVESTSHPHENTNRRPSMRPTTRSQGHSRPGGPSNAENSG